MEDITLSTGTYSIGGEHFNTNIIITEQEQREAKECGMSIDDLIDFYRENPVPINLP